MSQKRALIAGLSGQDGSYLAEHLLRKNYSVIGLTRNPLSRFTRNIEQLKDQVELRYCSYTEHSIAEAVRETRPTEIYNFTAQSYVSKSWELIPETVQNTGVIPVFFLEAISKLDKSIKFFQASSAEIYTPKGEEILTEESPINPSNPYGCSKAFAHQMVGMFRRYHGIYAVNGILFNHESPRRNVDFLSQKLVRAAVQIKRGQKAELLIGNLKPARDWGYAPDYMDAVQRMMELSTPQDLIISSGETHTVKEMIELVFEHLNLDWQDFVKTDPKLYRPFETLSICGSNRKIEETTGWKPKTTFKEMLKIMVEQELLNERI